MKRNNPLHAYRETQVRTASQGKLIVMLYDEAIKQIEIALAEFKKEKKKLEVINNAVIKAQDVITELMVSLDFERGGEIAKNLFNLYMFFNNQLMEGNIEKKPEPMRHVKRLLGELRDAWEEIAKKNGNSDSQSSGGINIAG